MKFDTLSFLDFAAQEIILKFRSDSDKDIDLVIEPSKKTLQNAFKQAIGLSKVFLHLAELFLRLI